jgi:hypothetical protein
VNSTDESSFALDLDERKIRAADAKEVGVGNPAEETCCYPNETNVTFLQLFVNKLSLTFPVFRQSRGFSTLGFTQ